jgi:hypothetical protein
LEGNVSESPPSPSAKPLSVRLKDDSAETIAAKVLFLEHRYFEGVIEGLL